MDSITIVPGMDVLLTKEKMLIEEDYAFEPDFSQSRVMLDRIYNSWVTIHCRPFITEKLAKFLKENSEMFFYYAIELENKHEGNFVELTILPKAESSWLKIDNDFGPVVDRESVDPYFGIFQVHIWKDGYSTFYNQVKIDSYEQRNFLSEDGIVLVGEKATKAFDNLLEKLKASI